MEKKASRFAPVLILKEPLTPGSLPTGGEVGIVMICSECQKEIPDLTLAHLVIDVDVFEPIGDLLKNTSNSDGDLMYRLVGSVCIIHIACDTGFPGVRIPAAIWTADRGRTNFRPRFEQKKKPVIN